MIVPLIISLVCLNTYGILSYKLNIQKSKGDTNSNNWINSNMRRLFATSLNGKLTAADVLKNPQWPGNI